VLAFRAHGRMIRVELPTPTVDECRRTPTGRVRSTGDARTAQQKATRQRWRALALIVKAKLEAVEAGVTTFEDEFLAHILLPDGTTVGQNTAPALEHAYETGQMPALLPATRPALEAG